MSDSTHNRLSAFQPPTNMCAGRPGLPCDDSAGTDPAGDVRDIPTHDIPFDPARSHDQFSATAYPPRDIALALGKSVKQAHRLAASWPTQERGKRTWYCVPLELESIIARQRLQAAADAPRITFASCASATARARALAREQAVLHLRSQLYMGKEAALDHTVSHWSHPSHPSHFFFSRAALRRWDDAYTASGLDGLVDQKQGKCGRKPVIVPEEFRRLGQAIALEKGSIARAARELAQHPDLPAGMRAHLHDAHASKSHVTPSIRAALQVAPLTRALAQGPRAARLSGRFTPGSYDHVRAGDVFTSDDMTSNIVCWCEWPNARGWKIGQPQILPVMDVRSLRWLNVRVILREGGQYSSDDIWGLFGDVFDLFGLPNDGFLLEGGHWQANRVLGTRTGLSDDERIGGLTALGLNMRRSYDPRSKGMLEGSFNSLQSELDRFPGFVGREQRVDLPEKLKQQLALVKAGHNHPREFFTHISTLADHYRAIMEQFNNERQDGQILRGLSPIEMWTEQAPQLRAIPDASRWLYRSQVNVTKVTRNGVRITHGSGPKQMVYWYDDPALLVPRQGTRVAVYWSDSNPDADAILLDATTRAFIGCCPRVKPLDRFAATDAELESEAKRKAHALQYARSELRAIQPDLKRDKLIVPADAKSQAIGRQITAATDRVQAADRAQAILRATPATATDRAAFLTPAPEPVAPEHDPYALEAALQETPS